MEPGSRIRRALQSESSAEVEKKLIKFFNEKCTKLIEILAEWLRHVPKKTPVKIKVPVSQRDIPSINIATAPLVDEQYTAFLRSRRRMFHIALMEADGYLWTVVQTKAWKAWAVELVKFDNDVYYAAMAIESLQSGLKDCARELSFS